MTRDANRPGGTPPDPPEPGLVAARAGESLAADFEAPPERGRRGRGPERRGRSKRGADGAHPGRRRTVADGVTIRVILSDPRVRVIILVVFVIMLGFGIVAPILPLYARSFGVGYGVASLLISSFAITRLVFDLVAGPIVDRFGERAAASAGIVVVGVSSFLTGLAPSFALAVVFRGAGGAGSAVLFASLYSYLLKVVPKANMARTLAVFYGAFNVGIVAGGPVGGLIARYWGLASPLFVYAVILFVSGGMYVAFVRDPRPAERPVAGAPAEAQGEGVEVEATEEAPPAGIRPLVRRTVERVRELLSDRTFVTVIFVYFAFLWMVGGVFDTLVPLFGKYGLHMSTVGIGGVFAVALATEFSVLYHAGILADRLGRRAVSIPSMTALGVMIVVVGWAGNAAIYAALMGLLGFASGYAGVPPAAMLADIVGDEGRGTAVGAFRFAGDLGFVFGPLVAGVMTSAFGFRWAFAVASLPLFAGVILLLRIQETLGSVSRSPGSSPAATPSTPR
ncbi:MAG TPA: MFS transporter [Actinomycetota bacterium]|nr:MFS transporter [Actinomycetota bacterium]